MLSLSLAWAPRGSSRSRNAALPEEMSSSRCSQMIHWLRIRGIIKWTQFLCAKDYLDLGLTRLHRRVRLDMHCKVEKKGVDPMSISPNNLSSDELCFVDIAPRMTWFMFFINLCPVKVFVIHDQSLPMKAYQEKLLELNRILAPTFNCLPYTRYIRLDEHNSTRWTIELLFQSSAEWEGGVYNPTVREVHRLRQVGRQHRGCTQKIHQVWIWQNNFF